MTAETYTDTPADLAVLPLETTVKKAKKSRKKGTPAEEFKYLGEKHADSAIRAIGRLSRLANPKKFEYTAHQVKVLEDAFKEACGDCFAAFHGKKTTDKVIEL